jgi:hypothetical protein
MALTWSSFMRVLAKALLILTFGLAVSGCSKCGDWYWGPTQHSCHDESNVN